MPGSSTWYSIYYRCSRSWAFHVAIVILCCCREMWSPSAWLTHVTSCWDAVIQCVQWFGTMLQTDKSFLLNTIMHSVLLSTIRAYCCCGTRSALELWGGGVGQKKLFLYVQVPGVDIVMDYYYWMMQHPIDQYTHLKCRKYIHAWCLRFLVSVPSSCISCAWLCQALSLS